MYADSEHAAHYGTKDSLPMYLACVTMHYVILLYSTYLCVLYCGFVNGMDKYGHGVLNKTENSNKLADSELQA